MYALGLLLGFCFGVALTILIRTILDGMKSPPTAYQRKQGRE